MNVRIGNIECRQPIYNGHEYEIVKWQVNQYYGNEEKMISNGYTKVEYDNGEWGLSKDFHTINSSCFKNPETCYVIAWLKPNRKEPDVNMEVVGNRMLDLEQKELSTFMRVYRIAYELIMEKLNEDESE